MEAWGPSRCEKPLGIRKPFGAVLRVRRTIVLAGVRRIVREWYTVDDLPRRRSFRGDRRGEAALRGCGDVGREVSEVHPLNCPGDGSQEALQVPNADQDISSIEWAGRVGQGYLDARTELEAPSGAVIRPAAS